MAYVFPTQFELFSSCIYKVDRDIILKPVTNPSTNKIGTTKKIELEFIRWTTFARPLLSKTISPLNLLEWMLYQINSFIIFLLIIRLIVK